MTREFIKLSFNICAGDFIRGGEASSAIKKSLMQLGVNSGFVKKVCIACYEAEMNIVIHSYGGNLNVNIFENKIEIEAEDEGPGIENIDLAMKEGYSTASDMAREMGFGGGMGLPNMQKSTDYFKLESTSGGKTRIKMIINIS